MCPDFVWILLIVCLILFQGFKEIGEILLKKFKWGPNFFKLNEELLDAYANCDCSADVIKSQNAYLKKNEQIKRERDDIGKHFFVRMVYEIKLFNFLIW